MAWLDLIQYVWPYDVGGFWEEAWKVVAGMTGLQRLRVSLSKPDSSRYTVDEESLVRLFRSNIEVQVPFFKVIFYWPIELEGVLQHFNGAVPFQIEIHEETLNSGEQVTS
jgi:hypothetical protein